MIVPQKNSLTYSKTASKEAWSKKFNDKEQPFEAPYRISGENKHFNPVVQVSYLSVFIYGSSN